MTQNNYPFKENHFDTSKGWLRANGPLTLKDTRARSQLFTKVC